MIAQRDITGLVLAGGLGRRMGGVDKGLQPFLGAPLAERAIERLRRQVGAVVISANRNLDRYGALGVPVWSDESLPGFAGPLAGFMAGLERCTTPLLVTVACDTPLFPDDLVGRLAEAMASDDVDVVVASALEAGSPRLQPTFCLMRTSVRAALKQFTSDGGRKIASWVRGQRHAEVVFDDTAAFANVNTLEELQRLQGSFRST